MRQAFIHKEFRQASLDIIAKANAILEEYESQSLVLTLRQLYYQFVARGLLPNKQSEYKRLGDIITDARLAGLIDWAMMEDRTRYLREPSTWDSPANIVDAVATQYKRDLWERQDYRCEVWIEKDALVGVIEPACNDMRVPYFACRGYAGVTSMYDAGRRFRRYHKQWHQKVVVFHLGDHDPSGIDMTRDNLDRLNMFSEHSGVEVRRLALNMDQVQQYNPPPNPAKETDTRSDSYIAQYGNESWELDALEPTVIDALIRTSINALIDRSRWDAEADIERQEREQLRAAADNWDDVSQFLASR